MPTWTEDNLQAAIEAVFSGHSLRRASREWGIPRQTLADRIQGAQSNTKAQESKQKLTPDQEEKLTDWILRQEALGYAPSHSAIRLVVTKILASQGDIEPFGKKWMEGLYCRNPRFKTKRGVRISYKRANGTTVEHINIFFDQYKDCIHISPDNTYNTDETGIMEGLGANSLVVGSAEVKGNSIYVKDGDSRIWTTIIETISATEKLLNPVVIFKGTHVQQ